MKSHLLAEMKRKDTVQLIMDELPHLIAIAKQKIANERVLVLEHVLQERGAIPRPSERPSERAMRLAQEERLNKKISLDSSD